MLDNYTVGYLAPINLELSEGDNMFQETFLYNTKEHSKMEEITEKLLSENKIFTQRKKALYCPKDLVFNQIKSQLSTFYAVVTHPCVRNRPFLVPVRININFGETMFQDEVVVSSFMGYEAEVYAVDACREYGLPLDCARFISFTIRSSVYEHLKKVAYG